MQIFLISEFIKNTWSNLNNDQLTVWFLEFDEIDLKSDFCSKSFQKIGEALPGR